MLDYKIILSQFPKWTDNSRDYYKYLVCGNEGIFATDFSRCIYTKSYTMDDYRLYDEAGTNHTSEIKLPKNTDSQQFIRQQLFGTLNKILDLKNESVSSKRVIFISLNNLRLIRQTLTYMTSINKKNLFNPVYIKVTNGKIYFMVYTFESVDINVCFDIDLDMEWEGFFNANYIRDFVELLIASKTLDFDLRILKATVPDKTGTIPGLFVKAKDFIAIINGLRPSNQLMEKYLGALNDE